jgi:muramoyltetrapeptide carboxypeptidase
MKIPLNRRDFIKKAGIYSLFSVIPFFSFAQNKNNVLYKKKILPKKLQKGNTIGMVAPGGFVTQNEVDEATASLQLLGFKTYYTPQIIAKDGYLAGYDENRTADMMHMFINQSVDAIFCIRGGYGTARILDGLDYETIKKNPKILIGYSDITALINALYTQIGLVSFHGPVASSTFNDFSTQTMFDVLQTGKIPYLYPYEREEETSEDVDFDLYTIHSGQAEGELVGGNLVVLTHLIGTKYLPSFKGKIIFLEEIREKPYKIDRMLTHLSMATDFTEASGIVCGIFNKCNSEDSDSFTLKEVLLKRLSSLNIPAFYGLPFGHVTNKLTLPVGIKAHLDADKHTLTLLEKPIND